MHSQLRTRPYPIIALRASPTIIYKKKTFKKCVEKVSKRQLRVKKGLILCNNFQIYDFQTTSNLSTLANLVDPGISGVQVWFSNMATESSHIGSRNIWRVNLGYYYMVIFPNNA
jgi:hypothetical protein